MVKMIRDKGVKILSYFIGDDYDMERSTRTFKRMYGNDVEFIDVTSVLPKNNEQSVFKEIGDIMKKPFTLLETCIGIIVTIPMLFMTLMWLIK